MSVTPDSPRALTWRILDRQVRPGALVLALVTLNTCYGILTGSAIGQLLDGGVGKFVAAAGFASFGLLMAGWWAQNVPAMALGLLSSAWVWTTIAAVVTIDIGRWTVSGGNAACWALLALLLYIRDRREK